MELLQQTQTGSGVGIYASSVGFNASSGVDTSVDVLEDLLNDDVAATPPPATKQPSARMLLQMAEHKTIPLPRSFSRVIIPERLV